MGPALRRAAAALLAISGLGRPAFAQPPGDSLYVLPPTVVTPARVAQDPLVVPAAVDVVDSASLARAEPRVGLNESLPRVPGVLARDRQNDAQDLQISIRGFGARSTFGVRGVRLYVDGIPASMPDGQGQVSHFLLDSADRVEVLRGPFSALYGNSSGGVIQLFTASPPARPEWRIAGFAGDEELGRGSLGVRGPWPRSGGFAVDGTSVEDVGFRDHSASRRTVAQVVLRGDAPVVSSWLLAVNGVDARAEDPQGLTAAEVAADRSAASPGALAFDTRKTTRQGQVGTRLERRVGRSTLGAGAYAGSREITQFLSVPVAAQSNPLHGGGVVDLDRDYYGWDARWRVVDLFARRLALTAGVERQISDERRRGFENFVGSDLGIVGALRRDEDDRVDGTDAYAQMEWMASERWRAQAGVRRSRIRFRSRDHFVTAQNPDDSGTLDYDRATPVAGLLWRASERLSFYANAGTGFETPTFTELAYRPGGASGLNTSLRPARSRNAEVGLRGRSGFLPGSYGVVGFLARTEDELVVATSQGGRTTYTNAASSLRQGVEVSWTAVRGPCRPTFAYSFLDARFRRPFGAVAEGARIPGVPRQFGFAELRWVPVPDLDVALAATAVDRVFANDANTASAPGYALLEGSIERRQRVRGGTLTGWVRVSNLLDRDAIGSVIVNEANGRYFEPAPGRAWVAGLVLVLSP